MTSISAAFNQNQMGIYNATSALLNQLPNQQQPAHHNQLQQQGKQQNGDFENFPTREDYRQGFTFYKFQVYSRPRKIIFRFEPVTPNRS